MNPALSGSGRIAVSALPSAGPNALANAACALLAPWACGRQPTTSDTSARDAAPHHLQRLMRGEVSRRARAGRARRHERDVRWRVPVKSARTSHEALRDIRAKYVEMLSMRMEHRSGDEDEARARERMARLAARFPGALRELDELELRVIRARIAGLDAVLAGRAELEEWMEAIANFHSLARGALHAKRWLGGRKRIDASLGSAYERQAAQFEFSSDALRWSKALDRIAKPPRGRLLD